MKTKKTRIISPASSLSHHRQNQLECWRQLLSELSDPSVEMTVETVAPVVATFQVLRRCGEVFDKAVIILMDKLKEQIEDSERDDADANLDLEDSDEDGADSNLFDDGHAMMGSVDCYPPGPSSIFTFGKAVAS